MDTLGRYLGSKLLQHAVVTFLMLSYGLTATSALQCACNVRPREISHMLRDLSDQAPERSKLSAFRQIVNEIIQTALKDCEHTGQCDISLKETAKKHIRPACMAVAKGGDGQQQLMSCYFTDGAAPKTNYSCTEDGMYLCYSDHCNHFADGSENPCSKSSALAVADGAVSLQHFCYMFSVLLALACIVLLV